RGRAHGARRTAGALEAALARRTVGVDLAVRVAAAGEADLEEGAVEVGGARRLRLALREAAALGARLIRQAAVEQAVGVADHLATVAQHQVVAARRVALGVRRRQLRGAEADASAAGEARVAGVVGAARAARG